MQIPVAFSFFVTDGKLTFGVACMVNDNIGVLEKHQDYLDISGTLRYTILCCFIQLLSDTEQYIGEQ